jgi:chromosome segregation ATPase
VVYLVTHIAISLVFAQLLGLLLGWLLWGYVARQRGEEVLTLRERLADIHVAAHRARIDEERQISLPEAPGVLIEGDMPAAQPVTQSVTQSETAAFFLEEEVAAAELPASAARPLAPDLEAQLKETRIRQLEQQLRELENVRDRLPLLQADLSDAIAGRRAAEISFQETQNDFEARASGLLGQIQNFENAAAEWDRIRDEFERHATAREKELVAVKASLCDLQNSQRPQAAEPLLSGLAPEGLEVAELRERYRRAMADRNALAAELEQGKQNDGTRSGESLQLAERVAELEQALRSGDASLREQVTRIESLLWRVAELEPFAPAAAKLEEDLRRQESEISGHMAVHAENADRLLALQHRIADLQSESAGQAAERFRLDERHAQQVSEWQQSLMQKDALLAEQVSADAQRAETISAFEARVSELEAALQRAAALSEEGSAAWAQQAQLLSELQARLSELGTAEQRAAALTTTLSERDAEVQRLTEQHARELAELQESLAQRLGLLAEHLTSIARLERSVADREAEVRGLLSAHDELHHELQGWKERATQLEPVANRVAHLEGRLKEREAEVSRLNRAQRDMDGQLAAHRQRLLELEPLAAQVPVVEQRLAQREAESRSQLNELAERHQTELTRLKVNSAQRIRRLMRSVTSFKV